MPDVPEIPPDAVAVLMRKGHQGGDEVASPSQAGNLLWRPAT
jgi:hypothetical protein